MAVEKRSRSYINYIMRYCYSCEICVFKSSIFNVLDSLWHIYVCEIQAIGKSVTTNARYAIGYCDICKAFAGAEGIVPYSRHVGWYCDARKKGIA